MRTSVEYSKSIKFKIYFLPRINSLSESSLPMLLGTVKSNLFFSVKFEALESIHVSEKIKTRKELKCFKFYFSAT